MWIAGCYPDQNAIISGHAKRGLHKEAIEFFLKMRKCGIKSSRSTLASVLSAIANLASMYGKCEMLDAAKQVFDVMSEKNMVTWNAMLGVYAQNGYFNHVHLVVIKRTFANNLFVNNELVDMYAKAGALKEARKQFERMKTRDNIFWNAIIVGYVQEEEETDAFKMFNRMRLHGIVLDEFIKDARKIYSSMAEWSVVSMNALISGYALKNIKEAIILLSEMQALRLKPSEIKFASLIDACKGSQVILGFHIHYAIVKRGLLCGSEFLDRKEIHSLIFHTGFDLDELTSNALIDMYAKCRDVKSAVQVFEEMGTKKDVISWNSMIVGFAKKGHAESSLKVFSEMAHSCVTLDDVTFLGVLTACSHAGADHYACIVDVLGRWGNLKEAEEFIDKLNVEPNAMIWANLLGACRIHGNDIRGEQAAKNLIKLEHDNSSPYVLLYKMYAASRHWNEARSLRRTMIQKEI
ncbi:Pentatricopeptide repeat-containing protein [Arachis hypogaea]|nr:Pentatricopeptide repeat-containing protein [Arachis hypogaea]